MGIAICYCWDFTAPCSGEVLSECDVSLTTPVISGSTYQFCSYSIPKFDPYTKCLYEPIFEINGVCESKVCASELPCKCFSIYTPCDIEIFYTDCVTNEFTSFELIEGTTFEFCSKSTPIVEESCEEIITYQGLCVDNVCPTTTTTTTIGFNNTSIKPKNECDVITIFPMGVECTVLHPTNDKTFDGAVSLGITGGTPPYTIFWEVGSFAPALNNLGVGEYSATVIDYYGDFTANTTCILTAETTTFSGVCFVFSGQSRLNSELYIYCEPIGLKNGKPYYNLTYTTQELGYVFWNTETETWLFCQTLECQTTPYSYLNNGSYIYPTGSTSDWIISGNTDFQIKESYVGLCSFPNTPTTEYELCVTISYLTNTELPVTQIEKINMESSSYINGQPSWTSDTGQYLIYWNTGSTPSQWTITGFTNTTFINNDPNYPPLSNWQILGPPNVKGISVTEGLCDSSYSVIVSAVDNDAVCGGLGSITATAYGGLTPYVFSIDGGLTYQSSPIFNNLTPGIYSVTAKDSNNVLGNTITTTISNVLSSTYTISLILDYVTNTFSITAPTLPGGVTVTFDLVMTSNFIYYPNTLIPTPNYNNFTIVNNAFTMTFINIINTQIPVTGPCTISGPITANQIQRTYKNTITMNSDEIITGATTSIIVNDPTGSCQDAIGYYYISMTNPIVNNCQCCNLILTNPKPPIPPTI